MGDVDLRILPRMPWTVNTHRPASKITLGGVLLIGSSTLCDCGSCNDWSAKVSRTVPNRAAQKDRSTPHSPRALSGWTQGIKREKIAFPTLVRISEIFEPCAQCVEERILKRDPKQEHGTAIVSVEIDSFRDFSTRNRKEDRTSPTVTRLFVVVECQRRLDNVLCLYKKQFAREHALQDSKRVPRTNDLFHIEIRREETDHAIGSARRHLEQKRAIITNDREIVASVKLGAHGHLTDMGKDSRITGLKFKRRGYKSIGDSVPEVIMTLAYRSNTGRIASDASKHESCNTGSCTSDAL
ncbi:hypothetical protein PsorP6_011410 [Peronosclerospora sorghi]|uniref:Uncharacterized protein n=1 Tax=Peronosclerospora sorghi TaxID=230839 RepID=A0ACC0WHM8_9STRA|nr:hypothetical protein PsorP6_011410 [Peronosclerospora sorghi]